jgi:hypothetical protein
MDAHAAARRGAVRLIEPLRQPPLVIAKPRGETPRHSRFALRTPIGDDDLVARYHAQVRGMMGLMPLAERLLHAELANHIPNVDDDE